MPGGAQTPRTGLPGTDAVTLGEVVRMMARLEAEIRSLAAQVASLTTVATETRAELGAHTRLQAQRTVGRDKEMAAVREQLQEHERALSEAERWRWTMVGRMAGIMAAAGAGGAGLMSAAARMLG